MRSLLTKEQLTKLNTKRLLAYRNALLRCHDYPESEGEIAKSSVGWQGTYNTVKEILATREHVERKGKK